MKILALELSSDRGSMALLDGGELVDRDWPNDRRNSGAFFLALADAQKKFGLPDKIIVGLGPGSYAGTRIAISAAIGLSFGRRPDCHGDDGSIALIGYPSICAIDSEANEYVVVGDARRQSFFFAQISENNLLEGPILLEENELHRRIRMLPAAMPVFGTEKLAQFDRVKISYPSARILAKIADGHHAFSESPLEPIYLRDPHITLPKPGGDGGVLADEAKKG